MNVNPFDAGLDERLICLPLDMSILFDELQGVAALCVCKPFDCSLACGSVC